MPKKRTTEQRTRKNSLRLRTFDYSSGCHFVTVVTQHRRLRFNDARIAKATINVLYDLRARRKFKVYSFCFMPNHFHGLIGVGDSKMTLPDICREFKSLSTREFWSFGSGKLWQRQYFDHVIRNPADFEETLDYIRKNPVKAGLVQKWTEWPWHGEPDL